MTTDVDIASMALGFLGEGKISSFAEKSNQAAQASLFYEPAKREVLRAFNWSCAKAWVALTAYAEGALGTLPSGWLYAYQLPADCIKARYIDVPGARRPPPFEIYSHPTDGNSAQVLLCNIESAVLVYTTSDVTEAVFPDDLVNLIAWKLAINLAMPVTRTKSRRDDAVTGYRLALAAASTANANEEPEYTQEQDAPWIKDRGATPADNGVVDRG